MTGSPTALTVGVSVTCCDRSACGVAGPDCIGPIAIPRRLTRELHVLAKAAAVDDFVPFWICATELVRRWSRDQRPISARVIREPCEAVAAPATRLAARAVSFRTALRRADAPAAAGEIPRPVDVTILVSQDGERLYIERMTSAADGPCPEQWARSFLQLLSALTGMPDAPVIAPTLAEAAKDPPDRAREVVPSVPAGW